MIITDLMEYDGKYVRLKLVDGQVLEGTLQYVPSWSEMYNWRRAHYFYIGENSFRCHNVLWVDELKPL